MNMIASYQLLTINQMPLMKKRLILSALLVLTCMITATAQKFALVDMEYIARQIPAFKQANQQMEALSKEWQSEIDVKSDEAKKLYEEYQNTADKLTSAQRTAKEEAIVAKEKEAAELRQQYFGPQGEMMKKQKELLGPLQDNIYKAIKPTATENGYDAVIDRASAQRMIFASPRIDISNEVLARLGYSN